MYGGLTLLWLLVVGWQVVEHRRVRQVARTELIHRAKDISTTLGFVIHSQRRFGGLVSKERIELALKPLIRPGELHTIALLNDAEEVVASAGEPIEFDLRELVPRAEYWRRDFVALMNLVDLGTNVTSEAESRSTTIVLPPRNERTGLGPERPPGPPPGGPEGFRSRAAGGARERDETDEAGGEGHEEWNRPRPRRGDGRFPFGRPFWMGEEEYRTLVQKQGVHSFVLVLSTHSMRAVCTQDLWARGVIAAFAAVSALGLGLAWRNLGHSSELEVRLARAAELNTRLKEMNLAAAGLAHETRNPLNIIRGLATLISRQVAGSPEIEAKSRDIIAKTDRVTAQLNEFINYSRPREVRWSAVPLGSVVAEVARALGSDLEERGMTLDAAPDLPAVQGDEPLVRQALFNLFLNAIQAGDRGGRIEVVSQRSDSGGFRIQIRDDGPGVPEALREEIFRPYFTTHPGGTGLGLAVVQQIVLAHGWEIRCLPNRPRGAVFELSRLQAAPKA